MAGRIELSESEIVEALNNARRPDIVEDPPGAFVINELARKTGRAPRTIRGQVLALQAKGLVENVKVYRRGSDGRHMMISAYVILRAPKAKARR